MTDKEKEDFVDLVFNAPWSEAPDIAVWVAGKLGLTAYVEAAEKREKEFLESLKLWPGRRKCPTLCTVPIPAAPAPKVSL